MVHFKKSKLQAAIALTTFAAAGAFSTVSFAQDQELIEEVVVTAGFRKSLIDSIDTKRDNSSVVEVISAEDIGKLPDSSIAESIARLPGLAAQRLDGRASRVSIRGFGENEGATTFNGREQVSISDNRGVEFDLYPSEIMSGVVVYKTPDATLEAEGIAGVIDMRTVKPLDEEASVLINGQFEKNSLGKLNPDGDDIGYRGTVSTIQHYADDKIGVAAAYTKMDSPSQENRWNSWGYPGFTAQDGQTYNILGGAKPFVRSSTLERESAMLVVEAQPSDDLTLTFDALVVDFSDQKILRGIEVPFAWGQGAIDPTTAVVDSSTGFVSAATTVGQRVVVRNDYEERNAELKSFGFNADYQINDSLSLEFDVSTSNVERDIFSLESYSGTGRGDSQGVADTIRYELQPGGAGAVFTPTLDYSDNSLILLGGPLTWGWQSSLNDKYGITGTALENTAQDGFINAPLIEDDLTAMKFALTQEIEDSLVTSVTFGVSYREREKTKVSQGFFMTSSVFPAMAVVPAQYDLGSVSLDFIGMGDMIAYDSAALVRDGFYDLTEETGANHDTKSWSVKEEVTSLFIKADFMTEIGGMPLTGNIGARYIQTDQSSRGRAIDASGVVENNVSHDYSDFLPSLNMSLALTDEQTIRFGMAKTMSRPRMDEMNSSYNISVNQAPDANGNYITANGGNPALEPKEALGIDLTYENYFSEEGYFSVAFFWKDINQWIFDGSDEIDVADYLSSTNQTTLDGSTTATVYGKQTGGEGHLRGYELSLSLPFNLLEESLDGFGLVASYTGIFDSMRDLNNNPYRLPGLSESITNMTVYYEKNGLQLRTSVRKRDDFKGDVYGLGFNTNQVDIVGETIVDAQIGYDFSEAGIESLEGLSIFLQGQNLTDEPFHSNYGSVLQTRDYQEYGKTYLRGFSYKM